MKRFVAFSAVLAFAFSLSAQSERGNITGIVTDPTGSAVAGAAINVVHIATNATTRAQTTPTGEYNAANLSVGQYRVEQRRLDSNDSCSRTST